MDSIMIDALVFTGRHGVNPEEKTTSQRFSISVHMDVDTAKASATDSLSDTINYSKIRDLVRAVVEGEHNYLIEKLGHRIATAVLADTRIERCLVTIKKPDVWGNGVPSVRVERGQQRAFFSINSHRLIDDLATQGYSVHSLLSAPLRERMKVAAEEFPFIEAEQEYGKMRVKQRFSYYRAYPPENFLWRIGNELLQTISNDTGGRDFATALRVTEVSAQRYTPGELGITPHHDSKRFRNLIAICVVDGEAEFYTTTQREGGAETVIPTKPGDVIFLRASGFRDCECSPLHAVRNITSNRLSITYRQE